MNCGEDMLGEIYVMAKHDFKTGWKFDPLSFLVIDYLCCKFQLGFKGHLPIRDTCLFTTAWIFTPSLGKK